MRVVVGGADPAAGTGQFALPKLLKFSRAAKVNARRATTSANAHTSSAIALVCCIRFFR